MSINEILRELRKERNLTQNELADILSCNRQKIADWERGKSTPSAEDIIVLSKKLNVSADYLLGLSEAQTNDKDTQFVCDYTGLSDLTIRILVYLKLVNSPKLFFINHLIKTGTIEKIAEFYYRYAMDFFDSPPREYIADLERKKANDISFSDREKWERETKFKNLILFECQQFILENIKEETKFLSKNCETIMQAMYSSYLTDFNGDDYNEYIEEREYFGTDKNKIKSNNSPTKEEQSELTIPNETDGENTDDIIPYDTISF